MVITFGQQYNVGEKPTVILYTYIINRHGGIPNKTTTKDTMSLDTAQCCYIGSRIGCVSQHDYITILLAINKQVTE